MINNLLRTNLRFFSQKKPVKVPTIEEVSKYWGQFSQGYNKFDYGPQTLYYSLLYMSEPWKARSILQVACGTGKLLPFAINVKKPDAKYLAVDLSSEMVELSKKNLKYNFSMYDSKISFEEWLKKMNFEFRVANAEDKSAFKEEQKFDRIICNCVLMLTSDPEKMLKNLHNSANQGCLMGVSVWGDKNKNNLMMSIRQSILEIGYDLPEERSNFHLYNKVEDLASKCGWQIVLNWEQNCLFPVLSADGNEYGDLLYHQINKLPAQYREKAEKVLLKKVDEILKNKQGLNFSCKMLLLRKK